MKNLKINGFNIWYGKKKNKELFSGFIADNTNHIGKTPYVTINSKNTDKQTRDIMLITLGQELRYLELQEINPLTPFKGKTLELEI